MNNRKQFSYPKSIFFLLLSSNFLFSWWLNLQIGSYRAWTIVDLSNQSDITLFTFLAVLQFALFGLTIDRLMRLIVRSINRKSNETQIPAINIMAMSVFIYAMAGLLGFILLYDHNFTHILATTGALGIGVAYIFREWIADITASIQIQTASLIRINDYIHVDEEKNLFKIMQIEHRMITIQDVSGYLTQIPTRFFLNYKYINITKQPILLGISRSCTFSLTTSNDSNRALDLMNTAMQYLNAKDDRFYQKFYCRIQNISGGLIDYLIIYNCHPSLSLSASNHLIYNKLLYIFNIAGFNLNSDIEIIRSKSELSDTQNRLVNIYHSSILKILSVQQIKDLSSVVKSVNFESDLQIIKLGEHAQSMYFISEGHLEVCIPGKDGNDMIVATLWPGDCVGEMSLLTGAPRSANVYTRSNGVLLEVTKEHLLPIFKDSPGLIDEISKILTERKIKNENLLTDKIENKSHTNQMKALANKIFSFFFGT